MRFSAALVALIGYVNVRGHTRAVGAGKRQVLETLILAGRLVRAVRDSGRSIGINNSILRRWCRPRVSRCFKSSEGGAGRWDYAVTRATSRCPKRGGGEVEKPPQRSLSRGHWAIVVTTLNGYVTFLPTIAFRWPALGDWQKMAIRGYFSDAGRRLIGGTLAGFFPLTVAAMIGKCFLAECHGAEQARALPLDDGGRTVTFLRRFSARHPALWHSMDSDHRFFDHLRALAGRGKRWCNFLTIYVWATASESNDL